MIAAPRPSQLPAPLARSSGALAALSALVFFSALLAGGCAPTARLTILHTNDTHGHLLPFSYPEGLTGDAELDSIKVRRAVGGIARRATLASRVRGEVDRTGGTTLLLDAGDFCDGTPFSTEYQGRADVAAMKVAGYDVLTFGNHEFSPTLDQVRALVELAAQGPRSVPFLSANVVRRGTGATLVRPRMIKDVGDLRLGIFGLTTPEAASYRGARDSLEVLPPIETARAQVAALRAEGADAILLLSHCGHGTDEELAREVPGLDIIVGGHSHSRLPSGEIYAPFEMSPADTGGTIIVQAHQWGGELGRLDVEFRRNDGRWTRSAARARLLPVTTGIPEDPATARAVQAFWEPIAPVFAERVGEASGDFTSRRRSDGGWDLAEYNLVADAVRESFAAEFDLENMGGVRAALVRGPITLGDLVHLDPFGNTVIRFQIKGRDLKRLLERHTPAVSGLRYRVENRTLTFAELGGRGIEDERIYDGTTNSYFAGGALKDIPVTDTGRARLDVLKEYIRDRGPVSPRYDGRRIVTRN